MRRVLIVGIGLIDLQSSETVTMIVAAFVVGICTSLQHTLWLVLVGIFDFQVGVGGAFGGSAHVLRIV